MNRFYIAGLVTFASALGLVACVEQPDPKQQVSTSGTTPAESGAKATANALGLQYEASLSEGIDFKRKGYPKFLTEVSGMSGYEPWGRWTEGGPSAKFRFNQVLPKTFTVEVTATAFGPNTDAPVIVRIGGVEKTFIVTNKEPHIYRLVFETDGTANSLELVPPKPTSPSEILPNNSDSRKLGIGLVSIKIS